MRSAGKRLPSLSSLAMDERPAKLVSPHAASRAPRSRMPGGSARVQCAMPSPDDLMPTPPLEQQQQQQQQQHSQQQRLQQRLRPAWREEQELRHRRLLEALAVQARVTGYAHIGDASATPAMEGPAASYTAFKVEVRCGSERWVIFRRLSSFMTLVFQLERASSDFSEVLPALPVQRDLEVRAQALHEWLAAAMEAWKSNADLSSGAGVADLLADFLLEGADAYPLEPHDTLVDFSPQDTLLQQEQNLDPNVVKLSEMPGKSEAGEAGEGLQAFRLVALVGKGSFGQVFLAEKRSRRSKLVAIKVLDKAAMVRRKQSARVEVERQCMALSGCPFVVRLHAAFASASHLYLVQDFCAGGELYFHLDREGKLSSKLARFYAAECAIALAHLHSHGVVYRDLKPENIMVCSDGHVKLVDFGLAKMGVTHALQGARSFVGTMEYLSPEMLAKQGHGNAVDWWALGMVLYEMLTGLPPWYSENRKEVVFHIEHSPLTFPRGQVSAKARDLLRGLLCKDPRRRLCTARGIDELRDHPYFEPLDLDKLRRKVIRPPYVPALCAPTDTSFFDTSFTSQPARVDAAAAKPDDHLLVAQAQSAGLFDGFVDGDL